ncbi:MAG: nucleotidyltransferase family protein, partial [Candidatus Levybacteria bacterium]|nr:nucleotidyltransferase family protein [Candidatus Levybacteria bacterium]
MQAIITAAGQSSRFYPFTDFGHKSFIPILGKPIIYHTLEGVKRAGIKNVIVITGSGDNAARLIEENTLGLHITHVVQEQPLGMGNALICAEKYLEKDFFVVYPHHADFHMFRKAIENKKEHDGIVLLAAEEKDLGRFGVLRVDGDRVLDIIEKPIRGEEPSNLRVVGIYLLCKKFLPVLKNVRQHHYNFEEAIAQYAKNEIAKVHITD